MPVPLDGEPIAELDLELTTRVGEVAHGVTDIEDAQEPRDANSLGTAILGAAIVLLPTAASIVSHVTNVTMWSITAILIVIGVASQIIGHRVFEQRQPALVDNPTHLLLGPMFVMAKLFIALGFRRDLAVIIQGHPQGAVS